VLGEAHEILAHLEEPATLVIADPPYALGVGRGDDEDTGARVYQRNDNKVVSGYGDPEEYRERTTQWVQSGGSSGLRPRRRGPGEVCPHVTVDLKRTEREMDCRECGQNVALRARHTFVDCALYVADHRGGEPPIGKYARALAFEVRRLNREQLATKAHLRRDHHCDGGVPDHDAPAWELQLSHLEAEAGAAGRLRAAAVELEAAIQGSAVNWGDPRDGQAAAGRLVRAREALRAALLGPGDPVSSAEAPAAVDSEP
jgi:hypothetical protein